MSEPGAQGQPDDALIDLLVKQLTEGLAPAELRELDVLDSASLSEYRRGFERAAAAISLAGAAPLSAPPPALKERLEQQARSFYAAAGAVPAGGAVPQVRGLKAASAAAAAPGRPAGGNAGWFAAAACLLLALFAWFRTPHHSAPPVADAPVQVPAPPAPTPALPTAAAERAALLAKAESLKLTLGPTKDPAAAGLRADVVWDQATQQGFIRFVGLSPNDPQVHQYQIWIFDGVRDQRYPVDGGVFDIPAAAGEVVIPIRAALPVGKPAAFAVTLEKPGGVVVSARDHVLALGAVG